MNTAPALAILSEMRRRGIVIEADGDLLRYQPVSKMTPKLLRDVKANKAAILTILTMTAESPKPEAAGCPSPDDQRVGRMKPHPEPAEVENRDGATADGDSPGDATACDMESHSSREWRRFRRVAEETASGWTDSSAWPGGVRPWWLDGIMQDEEDARPQADEPGIVDEIPCELRSYSRPDDSGSPQRRRHLAFVRFAAAHQGDTKRIEELRLGITISPSRTRRVDKGNEIIPEKT